VREGVCVCLREKERERERKREKERETFVALESVCCLPPFFFSLGTPFIF
jgi:hypothetical protein